MRCSKAGGRGVLAAIHTPTYRDYTIKTTPELYGMCGTGFATIVP